MPYESLVITLKEKTKELKSLQSFKVKIEERFKEKMKELKELQKDKKILDAFLKKVIPS